MAGIVPIQITLYGPDDEVEQTFSRSMIPWGILKKAIALSRAIGDGQNVTEEHIDLIASFVCEVFGDKFTVEALNEGADVGEMLAVIQGIVARASGLVNANPTPQSPKKK